jgi:hypothetical protein
MKQSGFIMVTQKSAMPSSVIAYRPIIFLSLRLFSRKIIFELAKKENSFFLFYAFNATNILSRLEITYLLLFIQ